jgi:hypothetical protein
MTDIELVVIFGGGALVVFSAIYYFYDHSPGKPADKGSGAIPHFNITFARLFALMTVAVLGSILAFSKVSAQFAGSAYTLLGTVAGYLAGAKPTVAAAPAPAPAPGTHKQGDPDPQGGPVQAFL